MLFDVTDSTIELVKSGSRSIKALKFQMWQDVPQDMKVMAKHNVVQYSERKIGCSRTLTYAEYALNPVHKHLEAVRAACTFACQTVVVK